MAEVLSYLRVTTDDALDTLYAEIKETLESLGAPPDVCIIEGEHEFWLPPARRLRLPAIRITGPEVQYQLTTDFSELELQRLGAIFHGEAIGARQVLQLTWDDGRDTLYVYTRDRHHVVGFHTRNTLSANELETLGSVWDLSDPEEELRVPLPIPTDSPRDSYRNRVEVKTNDGSDKALELFDRGKNLLVTVRGVPHSVNCGIAGPMSASQEVLSDCAQIDGAWSTTFVGLYDPSFDFDMCEFLTDGHYPLLSWRQSPDFLLLFQLALSKEGEQLELHAYSEQSSDFLESIVSEHEYELIQ